MAYQLVDPPSQGNKQFRQKPRRLKDEFQLENIGLGHDAPEDFVRSQWQSEATSMWFLTYRWAMAVFFGSGFISYIIIYFKKGIWFIYLTNWGFTACTLTSLSGAILVSKHHASPFIMGNSSGAIQCYWAWYWINLINTHIVSIFYWTVICRSFKNHPSLVKLHPIYEIWVHVLPPLVFTVDHMIVAHPARLLHCVYPIGFGCLYLGFAFVYYLLGGVNVRGQHYIYTVLDFKKPLKVLATMGKISVLYVICSTLQYGLYRLRVLVARSLGKLQ